MLVPYSSSLFLSINVLLDFQYIVIVGHSTWDMGSMRKLHVGIVDLHWGLCKREYKIKWLGMPPLNDRHSQKQTDCWPGSHWGICLPVIDSLQLLTSVEIGVCLPLVYLSGSDSGLMLHLPYCR